MCVWGGEGVDQNQLRWVVPQCVLPRAPRAGPLPISVPKLEPQNLSRRALDLPHQPPSPFRGEYPGPEKGRGFPRIRRRLATIIRQLKPEVLCPHPAWS